MNMNLKPQDVLVALKLIAIGEDEWSYNRLAIELDMSPSEVHAGVKRLIKAQLVLDHDGRAIPNRSNLEEFLIRAIQFVFVPEIGGLTRGMPTRYAAPPLEKHFRRDSEPVPVWPDSDGTERGMSFEPLYRSVPAAASRDQKLYELLVLVDAIRGGRARERAMGVTELKKRLKTSV